jgi:hypothetical protein
MSEMFFQPSHDGVMYSLFKEVYKPIIFPLSSMTFRAPSQIPTSLDSLTKPLSSLKQLFPWSDRFPMFQANGKALVMFI